MRTIESPWKLFDIATATQLRVTRVKSMLNLCFWTPWFGPPDQSVYPLLANSLASRLASLPSAGRLTSFSSEDLEVSAGSDLPPCTNSVHSSISDEGKALI